MRSPLLNSAESKVIEFPPQDSPTRVEEENAHDDFFDSFDGDSDLSQPIDRYVSPILTEAKASARHQQSILWGALQMGAIPFPQAGATANTRL